MDRTHKGPGAPASATRPNIKTSQTNYTNPAADVRTRVRGLLPAGTLALYQQSSLPACSCRQEGGLCQTCRSYDQAGRGIEAAALVLGQGGQAHG